MGGLGGQDDMDGIAAGMIECGSGTRRGSIDLEQLRKEIPALGRVIYMNTGSSGPSPRAAQEAEAAASRRIYDDGPALPSSLAYMERILAQARQRLASCLGGTLSKGIVTGTGAGGDTGTVSEAEIALTQSASHGISIVASGLRWRPGDQVIVSRLEHTSGLLPWFHYRRLYGIELVWVPETGSTLDPRTVAAAITPRTRLISISHVSYATGARLPVEEIAEIAARRGRMFSSTGPRRWVQSR
ncbi:MAG: aminotransferase class V-fold PLP-dependent enzyme [Limnochordales bacterium]|nr:aminotransferase class V-fold PLP-dependent enzyme [Limnochordales bacterium]